MLNIVDKLVEPVKVLLVIGIAYSIAVTGWYFFSEPEPPAPQRQATGPGAADAAFDLDQVVAQNLFGEASGEDRPQPSVFDAPETRLRLTLEGVFQSDDAERSAAIVAERNNPGELYLVGSRLPGNAVLSEVYSDRIILRRGSVYETLRFSDEPTLASRNGGAYDASLPDYSDQDAMDQQQDVAADDYDVQSRVDLPDDGLDSDSEIGATVERIRSRLAEDPQGTLSELGISPVSEEGSEGYRLGAMAQNPYLRQAGLQPGDVVLSVNGQRVGNVQQDSAQIESIMAQGSARLEIQRGNRRFFVTASLQ